MKVLRRNMGFTLIEILLVIIIIGILAAMVIPRLAGRSEQARQAAAQADIEGNISLALDLYELDNGRYPTTQQGLEALLTEPESMPIPENWNGPYLKKRPVDPWGRPYLYECPGSHNPTYYDLYSYGSDGIEGEDDIVNWQD
jgi:general secretion pathway protein G